MISFRLIISFALFILITVLPENIIGQVSLTYVGPEITDTIAVGRSFISGSERLILNGNELEAGQDYQSFAKAGKFVLLIAKTAERSYSQTDSLNISYELIPAWLTKPFGRPLPSIKPPSRANSTQSVKLPGSVNRNRSELSISGAKSFRLSARTEGASSFGQSLDLKIEGELSPGLNILGSVSDRGSSPTYGTVNARLSELDKLSLKVFSKSFKAELGDLKPGTEFGLNRRQRMTGLGFVVRQSTWHMSAVLSRPRGEFESIRLTGQDNLQGPYRLNTNGRSSSSGRSAPVVPGSETVWLDGTLLTRGANKDYQIDYSLGQITFNVNRPIDSRTRIEIDFEPQATDYKKELYGVSYGLNLPDSSFYISMSALREGDDKNEPLVGELSESDRERLQNAGDSLIWLSGVVADTTGSYRLVIDSLPDSVYQFVKLGEGDFRITFSYFGEAAGDYQLIGAGHYQYVGAGLGEYLPLRRLATPNRTVLYQTTGGFSNNLSGGLTFDLRQSRFNRNLFSELHDNNNEGLYFDLRNRKSWSHSGRSESFSLSYRSIEPEFKARTRLNRPEYQREFLLPDQFMALGRERLLEGSLKLAPSRWFGFMADLSRLDYQKQFSADRVKLNSKFSLGKFATLQTEWEEARATLDSATVGLEGESRSWRVIAEVNPGNKWKLTTALKSDWRKNQYSSEWQGTRFKQLALSVNYLNESLSWAGYHEDSLIGSWSEQLTRNRLSVASVRKLGQLNYDLMLTKQWLEQATNLASSFLGRLNLRYNNSTRRLNLAASYLLSEENKNARGIRYFEVAAGEGEFIFDPDAPDGGQYIPDADGNFIRLEEILSQKEHVRRGERSFSINKRADMFLLRLDSRHVEELLDSGNRNLSWVIPFIADESAPYLFFTGRQNVDLRIFPLAGFHIVNLSASRQIETRQAAGDNRKREALTLKLTTKEKLRQLYFEQVITRFETDRDSYYSGIGLVEGWRARLGLTRKFSGSKISFALSYRTANSDQSEAVNSWLAELGSSLDLFSKGRLATKVELYRHVLYDGTNSNAYQLTDNRPGKEGAIWSVSLKYGLKKGIRSNFTLSGRHADSRLGRILARGEIIATF